MSFQLARTILALVLTFSVREGTLGGPDEITWLSNYDAARAYARQNGQIRGLIPLRLPCRSPSAHAYTEELIPRLLSEYG